MTQGPIRYDLIVLETGMTAATALDRIQDHDVDADPVVIVRRQGIIAATYHRVGAWRLAEQLAAAEPDAVLAGLLDLDAANQVDVHPVENVDPDDPPYGVLTLAGNVFGFSEGAFQAAVVGSRRGGALPASEPGPPFTDGPTTAGSEPPAPTVESPAVDEEDEGDLDRFEAFPSIEAPFTVDPGEEFDVVITLQAEAVRHTTGTSVVVDDVEPTAEILEFDLLVTGPFVPAAGSPNTGTLRVDRRTLDGAFRCRLVAADPPQSYDPGVGMWTARITVTFSYQGAFAGEAFREIRVNEMGGRGNRRESDAAPPAEGGSVATGLPPADAVLILRREGTSADSTFRLEIHSPHLDGPVDAGTIDLGRDPQSFAKSIVRDVDYTINSQVSDEALTGIGLTIRDEMPESLFDHLQTIWDKVAGGAVAEPDRRVPDVLLLTDDWSIPWELLNIELDPERPPFLGAQVNLGRWPLQFVDKLSADPLDLQRLAVMIGYYQEARRLQPLPRAEEEGKVLENTYDARSVNADDAGLDLLLSGEFDDGVTFSGLHFAGHGLSNPDQGTYLMYSTGAKMTFWPFRAAKIAQDRPAFIFVNACQVGTPDDMLGGYGGLAGAVTGAGFRAFVAPLWSVADDVAQQISLGLYEASADGTPIAAYLREVRARFFQDDATAAHTTYLAYTYYGHPRLSLGGPNRKGNE